MLSPERMRTIYNLFCTSNTHSTETATFTIIVNYLNHEEEQEFDITLTKWERGLFGNANQFYTVTPA